MADRAWTDGDRALAADANAARQQYREANGGAEPRTVPLAPIDPRTLQGLSVPERQWHVRNWIPMRRVTGLYGEGGEGKTLLMQMLATATVIEARWLDLTVRRARSLLLYCEDDLEEMHIRQEAINSHYGCTYADLGDMRWLPRLGEDNTLMSFEQGRAIRTAVFENLFAEGKNFGAELLVVDTLADVFGGNEIERAQARKFVQECLAWLARELGAAIVVSGHPSLTGITSATGTSGSTAWRGTFRSQLYLHTPQPDKESGDPLDPNVRTLTRTKANYASRDETIELRWKEGVFVPKNAPTGIIGSIERRTCERVFMDMLDQTAAENQPISSNSRAGNYAPRLFVKRPDREGFTVKDFEGAVQRLFAKGEIVNIPYGRRGDERTRIARPASAALRPTVAAVAATH